MNLEGKVAFFTDAGRGIGVAEARALANADASTCRGAHRILETALRPMKEASWG